jgi:carboxyl-terminal processing protease
MSADPFSSQFVRYFCAVLAILTSSLVPETPWRTTADELGTIGVGFAQLFADGQPNHRGPLVVLQVVEGSAGAKAGLQRGDIVIAINGASVAGRELADITRKEIRGPIGGTVGLTIARLDGTQSELALVRTPYPPHSNPATDPFAYTVPGSWKADPRYFFPLPWSPELSYHGSEDLFYAPNFDQTDSPEYHSYLFFWWLEGTHALSAIQLQSDMAAYFRGLAVERGRNYGFTPDLSQVSATYEEDSAAPRMFGGTVARAFSGRVTIWDTRGKLITLNSEVMISSCAAVNNTAVFLGMSLEPRDRGMWKQLDAIRDTFRCSR